MRKNSGFTLIELILVTTILGIITVLASSLIVQSLNTYTNAYNLFNFHWQGQLVFERLTSSLQNIRSANDILQMDQSHIVYIDNNGKQISFSLTGNNLMLGINQQSGLLANVNNFALSFLDQNGQQTSTATSVKLINVNWTVTTQNWQETFNLLIFPRNLQ